MIATESVLKLLLVHRKDRLPTNNPYLIDVTGRIASEARIGMQ
jgi:hypothetical protein